MKFKTIPNDYIKVLLDRLIRLKPAYQRYERVFSDIVNKFLIKESSDNFLGDLDIEEKIKIATEIFNLSVGENFKEDNFINNYLREQEERIFIPSELSKKYLSSKLNLMDAFELIKNEKDLKINLRQILKLVQERQCDPKKLREKHSLLYPVEKIVLCEGATEEILLGEFARIWGYDFLKNGVYVIGAGGKNQVARNYYQMVEEFKIPIFILLDSDANETMELIKPKLRNQDKIYIIKSGEFEDILPKNLIIEALNKRYENGYKCNCEDFCECEKTAKKLYEIFKQKGFGEFKKADFAKILKEYLTKNPLLKSVLSDETISILKEIKSL